MDEVLVEKSPVGGWLGNIGGRLRRDCLSCPDPFQVGPVHGNIPRPCQQDTKREMGIVSKICFRDGKPMAADICVDDRCSILVSVPPSPAIQRNVLCAC